MRIFLIFTRYSKLHNFLLFEKKKNGKISVFLRLSVVHAVIQIGLVWFVFKVKKGRKRSEGGRKAIKREEEEKWIIGY